jgi:hypothetical protein
MVRWGAVLFNGLFLIAYFFAIGRPPEAGGLVLVGAILAPLGLIGMVSNRTWTTDRDQLEAIVRERGVTAYRWMRVEIFRQRVLIGRDEGWVGRREGALVFEGRTTRFEIVRDDLVYVPTGAADEVPGRLTVKSDQGSVDVWFAAEAWARQHSGADAILGWSKADRELAGPPLLPKPRSLMDRIRMAQGRVEWLPLPFIFLGLSFLIPADRWALIAIRLVLLVTGVTAAWIAFFTSWRKDDADIARLLLQDTERLRAARNVVIDTNEAGTGNPVANAAVG